MLRKGSERLLMFHGKQLMLTWNITKRLNRKKQDFFAALATTAITPNLRKRLSLGQIMKAHLKYYDDMKMKQFDLKLTSKITLSP